MLSFMTLGLILVIVSIKIASRSPYIDIYGPIPFVVGYTWHFLILLVATVTNIELFKSDNIGAVKEVKNLHFLNFWCDLYNFLIGLGVFCFGLEGIYIEVWVVTFLGLAYAIINMSPTLFLVIFNDDTTKVDRILFRATMLILQTICFTTIFVGHQKFLPGEQTPTNQPHTSLSASYHTTDVNYIKSNLEMIIRST